MTNTDPEAIRVAPGPKNKQRRSTTRGGVSNSEPLGGSIAVATHVKDRYSPERDSESIHTELDAHGLAASKPCTKVEIVPLALQMDSSML